MIELGENEIAEDLMIGEYKVIQSKTLYRFSSDAILLSRFAEGRRDETVADLCAGSGIVGFHFFALNEEKTKTVDFFELQESLADLCEKSIVYNDLGGRAFCHCGKLQEIDPSFNGRFSLVLCNPPYKKGDTGIVNPENHIALCRHEIAVTLDEIVACAARLLKFGGRFCLCQRTERLADAICSLRAHGLEPSRLRFVTAGKREEPYLFLVEARKGKSPSFRVLPPLKNNVSV